MFNKTRSTVKELQPRRQDGWNLPGVAVTSSRTHNAGAGRPNLGKRVYNESTTDSDYEGDGDATSSEDELEFETSGEEFSSEDEEEEEANCSRTAMRLFIEHDSLKK
jgi:hypothetical protein